MIERAQKKVEMHNFDSRKHVLEYDDVMNTQREVIYGQRRQLLEGTDLRNTMITYLTEVVQADMNVYCPEGVSEDEWDVDGLYASLNQIFPLQFYVPTAEELKGKKREEMEHLLIDTAQRAYEEKEQNLTPEIMRDVERHWTMVVLDRHWMEHLSNMEYLREGIGWRGYSGIDPLVLYKKEAFDMFQTMLGSLQDEVIRLIFNTQIVPQPAYMPSNLTTNHADGDEEGEGEDGDEQQLQPVGRTAPALAAAGFGGPAKPKTSSLRKVGRNDPCPCGSGKKYKVCHGR
ncbi:MAG TPA: SEC-C metal-binding domain-containing protein [Hyphomicrobiales bacterium]|nr:SEC-C metal-binding domain-containing protein [Hyphomicrobiales bacterium]